MRTKFLSYLLLCVSLLCSCSEKSGAEPGAESKPFPDVAFEQFDYTTVGGEVYSATIDEELNSINITNVTDGSKIVDVDYKLAEGLTIFPKPESCLGNWGTKIDFVVSNGDKKVVYTATIVNYEKPTVKTNMTIYTQKTYGRVTKHHLFDIKDNNSKLDNSATAQDLFINQDLDGVRIPIWAATSNNNQEDVQENDQTSGHPEPGVLNKNIYNKYITRIKNAQAARGAKDLTIFASVKSNFDGFSFPSWVRNASNKPKQYAALIRDFIVGMKAEGIPVNVLGIYNEGTGELGDKDSDAQFITNHKTIVDELSRLLAEQDITMPRIIGLDGWSPKPRNLDRLNTLFKGDTENKYMHIYGVHYYPDKDHSQNYIPFYNEVMAKGEREFWATEPHWASTNEVDEAQGGDMLRHSARAITCLWAYSDLGMDALCWWAYGTDVSLRSQLMKVASVSIHGAQPIFVEDQDDKYAETYGSLDNFISGFKNNIKTLDVSKYDGNEDKKIFTRAFIEGNTVKAYVINMTKYNDRANAAISKSYSDFNVVLNDATIDGKILVKQWSGVDSSAKEFAFAESKIDATEESMITLDVPVRSITYFEFNIASKEPSVETPPALEPVEKG